jgi:EAL domain-containing protein (putative c-di-GMP-specific phosphodiesterase class I)
MVRDDRLAALNTTMPLNANADTRLAEFLMRARCAPRRLTAVHLHVSRLPAHRRTARILRPAAARFQQLARSVGANLFLLSNGDIVFVAQERTSIAAAVSHARLLFGEGPFAKDDLSGLYVVYELPDAHHELLAAVRRALGSAGEPDDAADVPAAAPPPRRHRPFDAALLARLETLIGGADVANLVRRQPICRAEPGRRLEKVQTELYISIAALRETAAPDVDFRSDSWLFRHLTQTLDHRMLTLLARPDKATLGSCFSINLNVATILSDRFLEFDKLARAYCGSMVIEVDPIDLIADYGRFQFARDFLAERGHKLCLDGIGQLALPFIKPVHLGVDLVKLRWGDEISTESLRNRRYVVELIGALGGGRVILSRIDSEAAVTLGQSMGVELFQGRYIDQALTKPEPRRAEVKPAGQAPYIELARWRARVEARPGAIAGGAARAVA